MEAELEYIAELEARIKAAKAVIAGGYAAIWDRENKGYCIHGRLGDEDCISCYDEALSNALDPPHA